MNRGPEEDAPEEARTRERRGFPLVWLVPIAAAALAGYLGWTTHASRGPLVTVTLDDAGGLTAGQTPVRYKAVQVGTVEGLRLSGDLTKVQADVRMAKQVGDRLTDGARFWVVRPRLTAGSVSGLETIGSGAYIEFDPGDPAAHARRGFAALADPRVLSFHADAGPLLLEAGLLRLQVLRLGDAIAAAVLALLGPGRILFYLSGYDAARAYESPGTLLVGAMLEEAVREGRREAHFLRGGEAYKYAWGAVDRPNRMCHLTRRAA